MCQLHIVKMDENIIFYCAWEIVPSFVLDRLNQSSLKKKRRNTVDRDFHGGLRYCYPSLLKTQKCIVHVFF